jgi:hypothetical protein
MSRKLVDDIIRPIERNPLQAYLDNRIQLFDVIEKILQETGPAKVYISTFSTSEEFLRRIYRLKKEGLILRSAMLADLKASRKTVILYSLISNTFDECYLAENHSKVILIENSRFRVSICTSQNQTRGNRTESGMISTDPAIYETLLQQFKEIINQKAILLDGLFNGTDMQGGGTR